MIVCEKYIKRPTQVGAVKSCLYQCDMCKKQMVLDERYVIGATELGRGSYKKKWDLCEHCMKVLEKNVDLWYSRIKKN